MSDTVIRVENLGKKYTLSHQREGGKKYKALRDVVADSAKSVGQRLLGKGRGEDPSSEDFWALKDVSFEIKQGDRVGIIGRNGAGKSTLLKILSRITEPTTGEIRIKGRVASLLEVGTGFHPELTGRENIYLNGAILGMCKAEIRRKFDEIVDFAEVERFLDTPVKRYSSGMYVRLAFSVAAHLEPEILVVDEVLAVGDTAFQKKCLGKMEDVGEEGRTVIFVSHQMSAIEHLCHRAIVLGSGNVKFLGETKPAIKFYLDDTDKYLENTDLSLIKRTGTGDIKIIDFYVEDLSGKRVSAVASGDDINLVFCYQKEAEKELSNVSIGFSLHSQIGDTLSVFYSDYAGTTFARLPKYGRIKCRLREFSYSFGKYLIGGRITVNGVEADWPQSPIGVINVEAGDFYGTGNANTKGIGPVLMKGYWHLESEKAVVR